MVRLISNRAIHRSPGILSKFQHHLERLEGVASGLDGFLELEPLMPFASYNTSAPVRETTPKNVISGWMVLQQMHCLLGLSKLSKPRLPKT